MILKKQLNLKKIGILTEILKKIAIFGKIVDFEIKITNFGGFH